MTTTQQRYNQHHTCVSRQSQQTTRCEASKRHYGGRPGVDVESKTSSRQADRQREAARQTTQQPSPAQRLSRCVRMRECYGHAYPYPRIVQVYPIHLQTFGPLQEVELCICRVLSPAETPGHSISVTWCR